MISLNQTAFVNPASASIPLSQMLSITSGDNPATLTIFAWDRDEYTVGATGQTGNFTGNGKTADFDTALADGTAVFITFTLQPDGQYYNSMYGDLRQLVYDSSDSLDDVTNIAFSDDATDILAGYIGSATVVTQPDFTGRVPSQATPLSIAQTAASFVGQSWNLDGCWTLASTIAADAGASVSLTSTLINTPGLPNGEWIVAFNGPAGQTGDWQAMVTAGEMVVIQNADGIGHVTTCVSGSGSDAMLIDNATFVDSNGVITNSANDGSANDIIIQPPHLAIQEWAGVATSSVVIYELDCPVVTDIVPSLSLVPLASEQLTSLFSATDPGNQPITSWQVYDSASSDSLVIDGVDYQGNTAASALTTASLTSVSLLAGQATTTDVLEVRAYNGQYWGDWQSLDVTVSPAAAALANFSFDDVSTGQSGTSAGTPYSGPVAGLSDEYIMVTPDNLDITASVSNVFISLDGSTGEDAIQASSGGNNVLNGSDGSSFLVGGAGDDTFFLDDRHSIQAIWSTVVGFHSGDAVTIWGVTPADFAITTANGMGASGYTGLTWNFAAPGEPDAKLTLAGILSAGNLQISFGTSPNTPGLAGSPYMQITEKTAT